MSTKVFVGNLSWSIKQNDLKDAFEAIGPVSEAKVITKFNKSQGYGFVVFERAEDAEKAVNEMNKKDLSGREINVEPAKPNANREERKPGRGGYGGSRGDRNGFNSGYKGGRRNDGGYGNGRRYNNYGNSNGRFNNRGPNRRNNRNEEKEKSKDTLFVANLPFDMDDEALGKVFDGYQVVESRVVRLYNKRSRGYGFVKFESEEEQLKALNEKDGAEVEGNNGTRVISVKIATGEDHQANKEKQENENAEEEEEVVAENGNEEEKVEQEEAETEAESGEKQ